jgi:hypothetical protein
MSDKGKAWFKSCVTEMTNAKSKIVGAIEKGFERARLSRVEIATNLDLSMVPNYVAYKAALIREKTMLQYICLGLAITLVVLFIASRVEVSHLETRLRVKEYILAPGVSDFIPVAPQSVPDAYVQHAVSDFVTTLGNTNPTNIEERFRQLSSVMSPALQVQFGAEAAEWVAKARAENISEMLTILDKRIEADSDGRYRVVVRTRTDSFVGSESIGYRNEVVEMGLRLVPPDVGRRWFLEITSLSRASAEAFETSKGLGGGLNGK